MASTSPIFTLDLSNIIWAYMVDDVGEAEEKGLDIKPYQVQACERVIAVKLKMLGHRSEIDRYTRCWGRCFDSSHYGWCLSCYEVWLQYFGDRHLIELLERHMMGDDLYAWYMRMYNCDGVIGRRRCLTSVMMESWDDDEEEDDDVYA